MAAGEEKLLKQIFREASDPLGFKDLKPEPQKQLIDLGLDPVDRPVSRGRETERMTRTAEKIFQNVDDVEELRAMLTAHGLNDNVYDAEKNPKGILLSAGAAQRSRNLVIACALYHLSGVSLSLLGQFLGVSQYYIRWSSCYSPALKDRAMEVDRERLRFPLINAKEFPVLSTLNEEIHSRTGLELTMLFQEDGIPSLIADRMQLTLVAVLRILALAVAGNRSRSAIAREVGIHQSTVSKLLRNKQRGIQFSPEVLRIIEEKM